MNYGQVFANYQLQLEAQGLEKEALAYVFRELKSWSQTDLVLNLSQSVSENDLALLDDIMAKLSQDIPAQYITGRAYFADLVLAVDERVLIPRPETEELVQLILSENRAEKRAVLDIGTGSGAIALALAQARPTWQLTATDISQAALDLANDNAASNQVAVTFQQSDVFSQVSGRFDIIVSNPPYIAYEDEGEVASNVFKYEPHNALFAEEQGLAIYRQLLEQAADFLTDNGKIYLEIGYKQAESLRQLVTKKMPTKTVRILEDSFGKDRMVVIDNG